MSRILLAAKINRVLGGALVGPWDVDQLDEATLDTFQAMDDYKASAALRVQHKQVIEGLFARHRQRHPTYRK